VGGRIVIPSSKTRLQGNASTYNTSSEGLASFIVHCALLSIDLHRHMELFVCGRRSDVFVIVRFVSLYQLLSTLLNFVVETMSYLRFSCC
jgi:hypothetical protein